MSTQAGLWIDHQRAVVVLHSDAEQTIQTIPFDIGQQIRTVRGSHPQHPCKPGVFVAEDKLQRRQERDLNAFYDDVIDAIRGRESVLIFGPGEAKSELLKRLHAKKLNVLVELESADDMTEHQIAAKVKSHYSRASATKARTP
ncbi:hypothetical protein [Lacipirellula parvula]|uniref:Translational machinery protein n=1 Tax=Lacipirellula parvula TaxID=2650471 RepID=A0A5K7X6W2_9BACT|nr:hypothetical protein [Lacipirellula parvula]BBO32288.1 hypothetical protein PLANPX_1900 [Lacipirellula parvula]